MTHVKICVQSGYDTHFENSKISVVFFETRFTQWHVAVVLVTIVQTVHGEIQSRNLKHSSQPLDCNLR